MAAIDDYRLAASDFEAATREADRTARVLAEADAVIKGYGPLPPSALLTVPQIEDRARKYAAAARARADHDAAAQDLEAKTAARDAAWNALVAAS